MLVVSDSTDPGRECVFESLSGSFKCLIAIVLCLLIRIMSDDVA